jgi:glutamate/tyrosine decarboxylase-like PLP-dependent enzyme
VLRLYGAKKIREQIRKDVNLAKRFAAHVESDPRFELTVPTNMGLVCFNLKNVSLFQHQISNLILGWKNTNYTKA